MLALPNVTLVAVGTMLHELLRITISDCVARVSFGDLVIYSDRADLINVPGARQIAAPCGTDKKDVMEFYYGEAAQAITTSHALMIEWDAGIRDVGMWRDEFLQYDYIGAPWPLEYLEVWGGDPECNVGNGGFTLLSKKLSDLIYTHRAALPVSSDVHPSRDHRRAYEQLDSSIRWAPRSVAADFAFEHGTPGERDCPSFGYHDVFNWPLALDREEVLRRVRLIMQDDYVVRTNKLIWLDHHWPWVRQELGPDFELALTRHKG